MGRQDGSSRTTSGVDVDSSTAPILHMDLDAFFASVELLDRPELVDRPVVVAHDSARSVVTAANYPARKFGVRSAIPLSRALQLCPSAVVLEPHFEKYRHYSREVMSILESVTPLVERMSIDEAFLDVSGAARQFGSPFDIATRIRAEVRERTGLTCSIGAAATKFVAKLASGRAKPDGLLVVPAAETLDFLHPLPVGSLWGVGAVTEKNLLGRGIHTIGDLAQTPLQVLRRIVGDAGGRKLHELANGIDPRPVTRETIEKSIGHEVTFEVDISDPVTLRRELLRQAVKVGRRLRESGLVGRTIAIKVRFDDFTTIARSRTLDEATQVGRRIADEATALFEALGRLKPVRLIGVRVENLAEAGSGSTLLWDDDEDWREAERAIDEVEDRFGVDSIKPASLLRPAAELGPSKRRPQA